MSGRFCSNLPSNIDFGNIIKNGLDSYNKGKDIKILKKDNIYWTPFIECNVILGNLKDLGCKDFPYISGSFDESLLESNLYYYNYDGKTYISLLVYNYITRKITNSDDLSGGSNEFELIYHLNDSNIQEGGSDLEESIKTLQEDLNDLEKKTKSEMESKQLELTKAKLDAQEAAKEKNQPEEKELEYSYRDHKQDLRKLKIFKDYVEKVNKKDLLDILNLPLNRKRNINESDSKRLLDAIEFKDNKLDKYLKFDQLALNLLGIILNEYIKSKGEGGEERVKKQITDDLNIFKEEILKFFNLSNIDSYNR